MTCKGVHDMQRCP